jgi:AcrR family transcriptional regulator
MTAKAPRARSRTLSTPERILQSAEKLFSERGVDGVSLREITSDSGVNSAALHYHFGSKIAVLERIFELRAQPIAARRIQLLSELTYNRQGRPAVEDVLRAFLRPALESQTMPDGDSFRLLRARLAFEREEVRRRVLDKAFNASSQMALRELAKALPNLNAQDLQWRFHFLLGSMVYTMARPGRIESLSDEQIDTSDWESALDRLVTFAAAGFRAA